MAVAHAALGNNVVGNLLYIRAAPLQHRDFETALVVEMHVQRRLCEVVMIVVAAGEAFRKLARLVIVDVDECGHARPPPAISVSGLLQAGAGEVADRFRAVGVAAKPMKRSSSAASSSSMVMVTRCMGVSRIKAMRS